MLLTVTVFAPLVGGLLLAALPRGADAAARWLALVASLVVFGLAMALLAAFDSHQAGFQLGQTVPWVRSLGLSFRVGVDGVSVMLVALTALLTPLAVIASWRMSGTVRAYLATLLVLESAVLGTFAALDLLLFYVFFDFMLIPLYFLIGVWGGPRRVYAAVKFFLYTFLGGVVMLVGILGLYYLNRHAGHPGTFDYEVLRALPKSQGAQALLFFAFFAAFAIKAPLFPLHTWLPDGYTESPTGTTVLLSGAISKVGAYGFIRFCLPMFPGASHRFGGLLAALAVVGILYAAVVAAVQPDFKRLIAYSSMSHMGFIVLGAFAFNLQGLQGSVYYMIAHGITTGGLFFMAGMLADRRGTTLIEDYGGLERPVPRMAGAMLVMSLAAVSLPVTVGFVGEYLTLAGAFITHRVAATLAVIGVILAPLYMLWAYQRMWHGGVTSEANEKLPDLSWREWAIAGPLVALIVVLGLFPNPLLERIQPSADRIVHQVGAQTSSGPASASPAP